MNRVAQAAALFSFSHLAMPYEEILGERLFYRKALPGPGKIRGPVLFLHGLGANSSSWGLQFLELPNAGYGCYALDMPGFGHSPYGKTAPAPAGMAKVSAAFIEKQALDPCHVVGLSLGGMIALELGLRHANLVASLTLVSTAANLRPQRLDSALYYGTRFLLTFLLGKEIQARLVARRVFPSDAHEPYRQRLRTQIGKCDARAYRGALKALARFNVQGELFRLSLPSLIVTGGKDTTILPQKQNEMSDAIKPSQHITIEDAGHALPVEKPSQFNHLLIEFLKSLSKPQAPQNQDRATAEIS